MPSRAPGPTRDELIGAAFALHAERLHRMVASRSSPDTRHLADDACSVAWAHLVTHTDVEISSDNRFLGWVYTVARREYFHQAQRQSKDLSLDVWNASSLKGGGDAPIDRSPGLDAPHTLAEQREQLALLQELPPERREALLLQAAGHSYAEIGDLMGNTPRQVTRHISEGSARVRELHRERSEVSRGPPVREPGGSIAPRRALERSPTHDLELDLDL